LKLTHDEPLSSWAFKFNLRRHREVKFEGEVREWGVRMDASKREHEAAVGRLEGLHREVGSYTS